MKKLLLILMLALCSFCEAANIHAIYVADSNARGGNRLHNTMIQAKKLMEDIARDGDIELHEKIFIGYDVTPENVLDYIKNELTVSSDDVIFFHFSGHGYRYSKKDKENNPWPNLCFAYNDHACDFDWLNTCLKEKNPRLLISLADCCNSYIPEGLIGWLFSPTEVRGFVNKDLVQKKIQHLFLDQKGHIIVTGAHPGEYGIMHWGYDDTVNVEEEEGNLSANNFEAKKLMCYFSRHLFKTLRKSIWSYDEEINWLSILQKMTASCRKEKTDVGFDIFQQTPMFDVSLEK